MGVTSVSLKVKNLQDPTKVFEGDFMVDSGATYTVVPADELQKLEIKPEGVEKFVLADGKVIKRKIGNALFEYKGVQRAAPVLFGKKGDSLLLGVFTLEALGLNLDPLQRKLYHVTLRM